MKELKKRPEIMKQRPEIMKQRPEMTNVEQMIEMLPRDIQLYIFREYIRPKLVIDKIELMIQSEEAQNLRFEKMKPLAYIIRTTPYSILNRIRQISPQFNISMLQHTNGKKEFSLLNKMDSFIATWLMYIYH